MGHGQHPQRLQGQITVLVPQGRMSKTRETPRQRTFSFEGTEVIVAAAILNEWDKFQRKRKSLSLMRHASARSATSERKPRRGLEELWQRERALSEDLEALRKISVASPEKSASGNVIWRLDPGKLRNAAKTHERVARELSALADSIESPPRYVYARLPSCAESWSATGRLRKGFACVGCPIQPWQNSCALPVPALSTARQPWRRNAGAWGCQR